MPPADSQEGKHKKKSKKKSSSKKEKHSHKKHKKSSSSRHDSPSASSSEDDTHQTITDDMWVEKVIEPSTESSNSLPPTQPQTSSWMVADPTIEDPLASLFSTPQPKVTPPPKRDPSQLVVSSRELNQHLVDGLELSAYPTSKPRKFVFGDAGSQWRMTKLKRVLQLAEEEGRDVEEVALDRYGSLEAYREALEESEWIKNNKRGKSGGRGHDSGKRTDGKGISTVMFSDTTREREKFRRPAEEREGRKDKSEELDEFGRPKKRRRDTSNEGKKEIERGKSSRMDTPDRISNASKSSLSYSTLQSKSTPVVTPFTAQSLGSPASVSMSSSPVLSQDQLNKLNARVVKARLMGSEDADELERQYEHERKRAEDAAREGNTGTSGGVTVVPTIDERGKMYDFALNTPEQQGSGKKKNKFLSHDPISGERIRYTANDDSTSLVDLVRQEKFGRSNSNSDFAARIASDSNFSDDLDYLDEHAEKLSQKTQRSTNALRKGAINDYQRSQKALGECQLCYHTDPPRAPQIPLISLATKTYLALPQTLPLVTGHTLLVPLQHVTSTLELDDDTWLELRNFMKCLIRYHDSAGRGVLFFETVLALRQNRHTVIEAVPLPYNHFADAPAYFKEALLSSEEEWSTHKKVIDTRAKPGGFRRSMVKDLPYFHVWFDLEGGYGHVIEEEASAGGSYKARGGWGNFGKEVVAGILDLDPGQWRRPRKLAPREVTDVKNEFLKEWKEYDWTKDLEGGDYVE